MSTTIGRDHDRRRDQRISPLAGERSCPPHRGSGWQHLVHGQRDGSDFRLEVTWVGIGRITPQGVTVFGHAHRKLEAHQGIKVRPRRQSLVQWRRLCWREKATVFVGLINTTRGRVKIFDFPIRNLKNNEYYYGPNRPRALFLARVVRSGFEGDLVGVVLGFDPGNIEKGHRDQVTTLSSRGLANTGNWSPYCRPLFFVGSTSNSPGSDSTPLGIVTRSGNASVQLANDTYLVLLLDVSNMTSGPDGNLWFTDGYSTIVRITGLDTLIGGFDGRVPPQPPLTGLDAVGWTTTNTHPTFSGVAKPGAEVVLSGPFQKQRLQPVVIGQGAIAQTARGW